MGLWKKLFGAKEEEFQIRDNILNNKEDIKDIKREMSELKESVEKLQKDKVSQGRVSKLEKRVRNLEPVTIDLTNRERQILEVFFNNSGEFIDIDKIAEETGLSRANAGSHMSNLKNKVELDSKTLKNNKKTYKLPEKEKEKILGSR